MKKLLTATVVSVASLAFVAVAHAQVVVPPGQDFYATPMSSTTVAMPVGKIVQPAPAAKKHHGKRAMRHKTMKRAMKKH